jgi:serine/threonine protein kinase
MVSKNITPANIYIDESSVIIILKFHIASFVKSQFVYNQFNGSPVFYAPEVHKSGNYSNKSDVWSIGMITFFILNGQFPYQLTKQSNIPQIIMQTSLTTLVIQSIKR